MNDASVEKPFITRVLSFRGLPSKILRSMNYIIQKQPVVFTYEV